MQGRFDRYLTQDTSVVVRGLEVLLSSVSVGVGVIQKQHANCIWSLQKMFRAPNRMSGAERIGRPKRSRVALC